MTVSLGQLDRLVRFQRRLEKRNARNEVLPAGWSTLAEVMAHRQPVSDGERNAGAQVQRVVTDRLTTHWSSVLAGLRGDDQAVCDGITYDIVGVKEIGRRQRLEISVQARMDVAA